MMPLGGQAVVLRRFLLAQVHSCILMDTSEQWASSLAPWQRALTVCLSATRQQKSQHRKLGVQ